MQMNGLLFLYQKEIPEPQRGVRGAGCHLICGALRKPTSRWRSVVWETQLAPRKTLKNELKYILLIPPGSNSGGFAVDLLLKALNTKLLLIFFFNSVLNVDDGL